MGENLHPFDFREFQQLVALSATHGFNGTRGS